MLQSVTPLTLELIEFILKQQILLKHDHRDVILNRVALLSSFFPLHFLSLCCYILSFFKTDPDFSAVSRLSGVLIAI